MSMSPGPFTWILLGSTFVLSALWAAVLLFLVRIREEDGTAAVPRGHMAVELAWAVIPALLVLSVVVPTLQSDAVLADAAPEEDVQVAEVEERAMETPAR